MKKTNYKMFTTINKRDRYPCIEKTLQRSVPECLLGYIWVIKVCMTFIFGFRYYPNSLELEICSFYNGIKPIDFKLCIQKELRI